MRSSPVPWLLILAAWAAAFLPGLGERELWHPMEPRYASIAKGMLEGGDLLVPRYADELYDQKPPLALWAAALVAWPLPESLFLLAVRLPSALGALLCALGLRRLGARLFSSRAGWLAALVFLGCWLPVWSGRFFNLDTLVAAALVGQLLCALEALSARGARRVLAIALGALVAAAGLLVKGPVALVFALAVLLGAFLVQRRPRAILRSGILWSAGLGALVAAAWFLAAWQRAGDAWAHELLVQQGLLRLADETVPKKHHPLYYLESLWTTFAPWSLLLPFAIPTVVRGWRAGGREREALIFVLVWVLAVVSVLSLGVTRRGRYLLPALPALALLVGRMLDRDLLEAALPRRAARYGLALLALVLALGCGFLAAVGFAPGALARAIDDEGWRTSLEWVAAAPLRIPHALLLALLALAAPMLLLRRAQGALLAAVLVSLCLIWATWGLRGAPAADHMRGNGPFLRELSALLDEGRELWIAGHAGERESGAGWFHVHTGRRVRVGDCDGVLVEGLANERPIVLLVSRRDRLNCARPVPPGFRRLPEVPPGYWGFEVWINDPEARDGR